MQRAALKYRLKGNTLVEVLIAFAIICFCSGLGCMMFLNIQKSSLPFFKIKAVELAEAKMKKILESKNFAEETFREEEFFIRKIVSRRPLFPDCCTIRLMVFNAGHKKIYELESIMLIK